MNTKTENALVQVRTALMLYEDLRLATLANDEKQIAILNKAVASVVLGLGTVTLRHIEECLEDRWMTELNNERNKNYA